ncbi:MAG: PaaI family thioesterase [Acidobacteriota bacterium]|nr:MAG: PaaI family thioesterase [Acidobacteriota bacterium]
MSEHQERAERMTRVPFHRHLGLELEQADPNEFVVALEMRDHHKNLRGVPHGGVISTLLDVALGGAVIASVPEHWWCATLSLSVSFVGAARGGRLRARGRITRRRARVAFAEGRVEDEQGRVIATGQGCWNLWPHHPDRPPAER